MPTLKNKDLDMGVSAQSNGGILLTNDPPCRYAGHTDYVTILAICDSKKTLVNAPFITNCGTLIWFHEADLIQTLH